MIFDTYSDTYKKLYNKYNTLIGNIEKSHDENEREINDSYYKAKNDLSAASAKADKELKNDLLDMGLSRSGDSVQAEISGNLAKNAGVAALDAEKNKALRENELSRSKAHGELFTSYLDKAAGLDEKLLADYIKQMNADRDYEYKESRDAESDRQWQAEFDAKSTDSDRNYALKSEQLEMEKNQQAFDNDITNQKLDIQREQSQAEIDAKDRQLDLEQIKNAADAALKREELEIKKETAKLENAEKSLDIYNTYFKEESSSSGNAESPNESGEDTRLVPKISASNLVDNIFNSYLYNPQLLRGGQPEEEAKKAIAHIIANRNINYDYRYEVKIYAKSLGLYDD